MPQWLVSLPDRLDSFLASDGRMLSRAKAQKAIEDGLVMVNDEVTRKPAFRVQEGDKISLSDDSQPATRNSQHITPSDLHLPILYEDDACLVVNKPAGIAVHPGSGMAPGELTILHGIAYLFGERGLPHRGEPVEPFFADSVLVHRLDKDTTGCLLIAKTPAAHLFLQEQFETRTVKKLYLALVAGIPKLSEATVDAPIGRSVSDRTLMTVFHTAKTREAQTTYRVLAAGRDAALLECELHTGRTHQIRVHLHSIGHPVLGDSSYSSILSERLNQEFDIRSLCLHAKKIDFLSPADNARHEISAPVPKTFETILQRAEISVEK